MVVVYILLLTNPNQEIMLKHIYRVYRVYP